MYTYPPKLDTQMGTTDGAEHIYIYISLFKYQLYINLCLISRGVHPIKLRAGLLEMVGPR